MPTASNPIVQTFWVSKHYKIEDPNSTTALANHQHLIDHQLTLPLNRLPENIPVGHEAGKVGPNPRIPTPEEKEYREITDDSLSDSDPSIDPVIMRKKLDRPTIVCDQLVETGKTMTDEDGKTLREIKVTYNQPWHGILNGGNRIYAIVAAIGIARKKTETGDFSAIKLLGNQYMDLVFSIGYTKDQSFQISNALNKTKKVQGWAQLHHAGKLDWFVDSLNGKFKGYDDKYLQELNPNLSDRVAFLAGSNAEITVEEALQVVRMFNREEFPHKEATPNAVHEAKGNITKELKQDNHPLGSQLQKLGKVAPYLLMMHDYIRLNAHKWRPGRPVDSFYVSANETNLKKIVFLTEEKQEALQRNSRLLVRSLAHPLCFGLSQYLIENEKGHWDFLSKNEFEANGQQYQVELNYRAMLSIIDDLGPFYMEQLSKIRGEDDTSKLNGFLRNPEIWEKSYQLVREQIESSNSWKDVAFLPETPSMYKRKQKATKVTTSSPKPAAKVVRSLTANN